MRKKSVLVDIQNNMSDIYDFLKELENELSGAISELQDADPERAVEVCQDVANRLNKYYQQI